MPLTSIDFPFQPLRGVGLRVMALSSSIRVMRGLDPRIHPLRKSLSKMMDCRVKPGNDGALVYSISAENGRVMKTMIKTTRLYDWLLATVLLSAIAAPNPSPALAAGCSFEPQGEGRVTAIIDARTFRMEDGREVRLAGIEPATAGAGKPDGSSALALLITGRDVLLRGETDAPDRYGRQPAFVFSDREDTSVQSQLLAQGEALVSGTVADRACAAELAGAEAAARLARRGIWAGSAVIKNAESPGDILSRIGQFTVVEGKVLSVRQVGAVSYINFGRRWTRDFAVTISRRMVAAFEAAGIDLKSLENKRIRVRGFIEARGGPRIEALRVGQIEVAGAN
jgi:endonuclease YncB( thermonuclease family)